MGEKIGYTEIGDINNIDVRTMNVTDDDNKDIAVSYTHLTLPTIYSV